MDNPKQPTTSLRSLATKLGAKGLQAYSIHPGVYLDSSLDRFLDWDKDFDSLSTTSNGLPHQGDC